jgi:TolA-binding protein
MRGVFLGTVVAVLVVVAQTPAYAQYVQRKKVDVDVEEVKRNSAKDTRKNQLNRSAIFSIEVEKKLIDGIDKTLAFYRKQYKRMSPGSDARLNIMTRVLDLNLEQASYVRNEEERVYDRQWTAWDLNGGRGKAPKVNTQKSFRHWNEVIRQADQIMKEYPRNRESDKIIFTKAFALSYIGKEKEAAKIYTQLIQNYPNSSVAGDAYASLGDFYFDQSDYRNALNNFKSALEYRQSQRFLWAMFKIGWCHYNLGRYQDAMVAWKDVVRLAKSEGDSGLRLKDEALRDMVFAYAETKDVKGAIAYYRANGGSQYIGGLLTLLAQELADDGNFPEAIKTFKLLQKLLPTDPSSPEAQKELISLSYELGKLGEMWKELTIMASLYGGDGRWAQANAKDRELVLNAKKSVKDQILYYAKILHKRGIQTNSEELHKQAKIGYLMFLDQYPKTKETVEIKFNLADVEFFLKDYRSAGQQYLEIVMRGKSGAITFDANTKKQTNVHKDSALYMVDSYARDFQTEFKALQKEKVDFTKPAKALSPRAKNYVKACSLYVQEYPADSKLRKTCEVDIARIYYHSNDKEQSRKYLWVIATKYPNTKDGPEAVESLVPLYADDKPKLLEIAEKLLRVPAYAKGKLGDKLRALKSGAAKESVAKEKDPAKRAKMYESLAKKNPQDPEADVLLSKASDNYLQAGDVPGAIAANLLILDRYPKSPQAKSSMLDIAQLYEKRLDFVVGAGYFDKYHRSFPQDAKAKAAHAKSCELLLAVDSQKAEENCLGFARKYPKEAADIVDRLIVSAQRDRRFNEMNSLINREYLPRFQLSPNARIIALQRIVSSEVGELSTRAMGSILAEFQRAGGKVDGEALRYVGAILFRRANSGFAAYQNVKLAGGTVDRLQQSIEKKGAELLKLKSAFQQVLQARDSFYGVATLHQLGLAHEQLAAMLARPPEIQGAKPEEVAKQLEPQVNALRQEATNYYQEAYKLVQQFKVYNDWSVRTINAFFRINEQKLSFDDYVVTPDFAGSEVATSIISSVKPSSGGE